MTTQVREEFCKAWRKRWAPITRLSDKAILKEYEWVFPLINRLVSQAKNEGIQEAIDLSDKIEQDTPNTEYEEWRAFKRFRNTLRDSLKSKGGTNDK